MPLLPAAPLGAEGGAARVADRPRSCLARAAGIAVLALLVVTIATPANPGDPAAKQIAVPLIPPPDPPSIPPAVPSGEGAEISASAPVEVGSPVASPMLSGPALPDLNLMQEDPEEVLSFGAMSIPRWLAETVVRASQVTGVSTAYIMALADKESSFLHDVRARTSSAEGLFQFIEETWLITLRRHARKHGFGGVADAIRIVAGRAVVADEDREWILGLRRDPYLSALMAAELIKKYEGRLNDEIAREPSETELYLAHFLGPSGAVRFAKLLADKPDKKASRAFPRAAKANRNLFYRRSQKRRVPLTVAEVHKRIGRMIENRLERYEDAAMRLGLPAEDDKPAS